MELAAHADERGAEEARAVGVAARKGEVQAAEEEEGEEAAVLRVVAVVRLEEAAAQHLLPRLLRVKVRVRLEGEGEGGREG